MMDPPADRRIAADVLRRSRVARIATVSRSGRPSVNPLYFVEAAGHLWLGTSDWTLAARNVAADPRVVVLLQVEGEHDEWVLSICGMAQVRQDARTLRIYNRRVALRYVLTPGGLRDALSHRRLIGPRRRYYAQGRQKGSACVIDVTPDRRVVDVTPQRASP
jgi:hypothetical protein